MRYMHEAQHEAAGEIDVAGKIDCQTIARDVAMNIGFDSVIDNFSSVDSRHGRMCLFSFLR